MIGGEISILAARLSDEDEEGEPLELDDPAEEELEDDDAGELVEDEEEEKDLPPTVRIAEEGEEDKTSGFGEEI